MDYKFLRTIENSIPTTIDLTASGAVLQTADLQLVNSGITASKPAKLDVNKKLISGNIALASEVSGTLPVANGGTNSATALNNGRIMSSVGGAIVEAAAITANRALISDANGIPTHSATTHTELGYLSGVTSGIQAQLNALTTGYSRRLAVKSVIADNTLAPPTEVTGDRYILSVAGGTPHANWDGADAGDIVEFDGTVWVETNPIEGYVAYVDDINKDALYVDDGTPVWELRVTAVNDHNDLANKGTNSHSTIDSHLSSTSNPHSVTKTQVGLTNVTDNAQVKAVGATVVSGNLATFNGTTGDSIQDSGSKVADFATAAHNHTGTYEPANSNIQTHIGSTSNPHSVTKAQVGLTNVTDVAQLPASYLSTEVDLDDGSGASDTKVPSQLAVKTYVDSAVSAPDALDFPGVAGEEFAANKSFLVRLAIASETAGRLYKCTSDETNAAGKSLAVGMIQTGGSTVNAGDPVTAIKFKRSVALKSGDTVLGASAADQGKAVWLNKDGSFSLNPKAGITTSEKYASRIVGALEEYSATVTSEKIMIDIALPAWFGFDLA